MTKAFCLWFTGLSGSGKSTVAELVEKKLKEKGLDLQHLDGDVVRQDLTKDLGFSKEDRDKNIQRVSFVAELLDSHGIPVITTFISPFREERQHAREKIDNFIEVYVKCPLQVCEKRDVKGLYKKARAGQIPSFTGISQPYEEPEHPEIVLETDKETIEESAQKVINYLIKKGFLKEVYTVGK